MRTGLTPIVQAPSEKVSCFVSPLHPDVRRHELDVVRELVTGYDIDGLVLDRCRYSNLYNDFSDRSRAAFEQAIQQPVARWPQDVFAFSPTPGGDIIKGPLYKPWLEFRARVIRDFVAEIARTARSLKPGIILGTYVGSWYPSYYQVGVNWGSDKTNLRYSWFTPDYPRTGYAEFFDWVSTGCYYPVATRTDARQEGLSEPGNGGVRGGAVQSGRRERRVRVSRRVRARFRRASRRVYPRAGSGGQAGAGLDDL